jgi:hypothetical protein
MKFPIDIKNGNLDFLFGLAIRISDMLKNRRKGIKAMRVKFMTATHRYATRL